MSCLHRAVEVKTSKQHYMGHIVGELYKSGSFYVKINKVIKGSKKINSTGKFLYNQCVFN